MRKKDERGLMTFAEFRCKYNTEITVKESSAASGPHIWIFMQEDPTIFTDRKGGHACAHLSFAQAKKLIKALETAMAEHYQVKP